MINKSMDNDQKLEKFIASLRDSIPKEIFIKLSLGNYVGIEKDLKKIQVKKFLSKGQEKLSFTYHFKTRDIVKNYNLKEGMAQLIENLQTGFQAATIFTTEYDMVYSLMNSKSRLDRKDPSHERTAIIGHDKQKNRIIDNDKKYLRDLNLTDEKGRIYDAAQDKFKQINKYIEIIAALIKSLPEQDSFKIADMGSGKGYLTFALYDYLTNNKKMANITGVEYRQDMVDLCNEIAMNSNFENLHFVQGGISDYEAGQLDILIALHACDTATDDAIAKGIRANAKLIIVAPCCHKQIRKEIESFKIKNELNFITRHGILLERQAEMVTDAIRALVLEYSGYSTKVFEFISDAHTAKNIMIVGTKNLKDKPLEALLEKISNAKKTFGINEHYLEKIMGL